MQGPILIAYDGSTDARRAVAAAATLSVGRAVVATVWHPPLPAGSAGLAMGELPVWPDPALDEQLRTAAQRTADEGVDLAHELGLAAEPIVLAGGSSAEIARVLAQLAEERDAAAIVVGRRGISRLESVVLGSVSDTVVREAHCPVLVVPAPDED